MFGKLVRSVVEFVNKTPPKESSSPNQYPVQTPEQNMYPYQQNYNPYCNMGYPNQQHSQQYPPLDSMGNVDYVALRQMEMLQLQHQQRIQQSEAYLRQQYDFNLENQRILQERMVLEQFADPNFVAKCREAERRGMDNARQGHKFRTK